MYFKCLQQIEVPDLLHMFAPWWPGIIVYGQKSIKILYGKIIKADGAQISTWPKDSSKKTKTFIQSQTLRTQTVCIFTMLYILKLENPNGLHWKCDDVVRLQHGPIICGLQVVAGFLLDEYL